MAPDGTSLWLLLDCCAVELQAHAFADTLLDYAAKVGEWRDNVASYGLADGPDASDLSSALLA